MLQVSAIFSGISLIASPQAGLTLTYSAIDTDSFISSIVITVDWGDGGFDTSNIVLNPYGPVALLHSYRPGIYQVKITAINFRSPDPDTSIVQQKIIVIPAGRTTPDAPPVVFGPILPSSQGFPSSSEWNFNSGKDGTILESSLTMLLLTRRGERIFDSNYGTNLSQLIFSLSRDDLPGVIKEEISRAVAAYEPRVELIGTNAKRDNLGRQISIQAEFRSKISGNPLVLNLGFTV